MERHPCAGRLWAARSSHITKNAKPAPLVDISIRQRDERCKTLLPKQITVTTQTEINIAPSTHRKESVQAL
jgi:hypothetical protein